MRKEKFEDNKGIIRSRELKKDKQYNCQQKRKKRTQKTRDRATLIDMSPWSRGDYYCNFSKSHKIELLEI
jgi:Ni/Co efflux regulator RcnB